MGRHYSHIDLAERRRIQQMRGAKLSVAAIAASLGPSVSGVFLRDG